MSETDSFSGRKNVSVCSPCRGGREDANQSVYNSTVKEFRQEAGLAVEAVRFIAFHGVNRCNGVLRRLAASLFD